MTGRTVPVGERYGDTSADYPGYEVLVANPERSIVPHLFVQGAGQLDTALCGAPLHEAGRGAFYVRDYVCEHCISEHGKAERAKAWRRSTKG